MSNPMTASGAVLAQPLNAIDRLLGQSEWRHDQLRLLAGQLCQMLE
jgi:hypothetical protein